MIAGLIPARGWGAEPGKNLWPLAGKPLVAWTIEAAQGATALERIVVSTNSPDIAAVASDHDAEVIERPEELAADETPMRPVIEHALAQIGACDVLVLLQPTSPLRRAEQIDEAVRLLLDSGADSVVSVVEVPHQFRPDSLMGIEAGRLVPLEPRVPLRRQEKAVVYARNGPAVLALRPERLGEGLYDGDCRPYVMDVRDSIDVDGPFDLHLAELLLQAR